MEEESYEYDFHGIPIKSLVQVFDEFILIYSSVEFKESLISVSEGQREIIVKLIETKQREIFDVYGIDPAIGFQLLPKIFTAFSPKDPLYKKLVEVVKAEENLMVSVMKEQPRQIQFDIFHPFDSILFPAPVCQYDTSIPGLFWIPRELTVEKLSLSAELLQENSIPCVFHPAGLSSSDLPMANTLTLTQSIYLIYCHANACDMGQVEPEVTLYCKYWNVNVISMEYQGYGINKGKPDALACKNDLMTVYQFLVDVLNVHPKCIIFFGRSVGSGPCCHVVGKLESKSPNSVGGLILQSPFTCVRDVALKMVGYVGVFSPNPFDNIKHIKNIHCPVLFIHGLADKFIIPKNSEDLHDSCPSNFKQLALCENADHNVWDYVNDILEPIRKFLLLIAERNADILPQPKIIPINLYSTIPLGYLGEKKEQKDYNEIV